jgi:transcription initiation factor TFIIIB Brf1 subunit/transcription initiation factor TFIIB
MPCASFNLALLSLNASSARFSLIVSALRTRDVAKNPAALTRSSGVSIRRSNSGGEKKKLRQAAAKIDRATETLKLPSSESSVMKTR